LENQGYAAEIKPTRWKTATKIDVFDKMEDICVAHRHFRKTRFS